MITIIVPSERPDPMTPAALLLLFDALAEVEGMFELEMVLVGDVVELKAVLVLVEEGARIEIDAGALNDVTCGPAVLINVIASSVIFWGQ